REVDYVLVYECDDPDGHYSGELELNRHYRELYESAMRAEGLLLDQEFIGDYVFLKVHCPFQRLCQEAENVRLDLPLDGVSVHHCTVDFQKQHRIDVFQMRVNRRISQMPRCRRQRTAFAAARSRNPLVRSREVCFGTHHVLTNIDIAKSENENPVEFHRKKGLSYLLMKSVYLDAFVMHDRSVLEPVYVPGEPTSTVTGQSLSALKVTDSVNHLDDRQRDRDYGSGRTVKDTRTSLDSQWRKLMGGQPLDSIRDYFGEKISFYFAWVGTFIASLVVPAVIGLGVFFFGVIEKVSNDKDLLLKNDSNAINYTDVNAIIYTVDVIKAAGDTFLTPFFAFTVCLWG
ncbi:unnamed protein product, partial [Ixodes persulcatus]